MDPVAGVSQGECAIFQDRHARHRPQEGLVGRGAELQVVPGFAVPEERPQAADGRETDQRVVDQIRRDVPRVEFERQRLREFDFRMGADVFPVADNG